MENQKIINLLNKDDIDSKHFAIKKWYIINDENNTNYGVDKDTGANNPDTIKYDTRVLKPNLCDYAEAYILVDGTIRPEAQILPAPAPNIANVRLALKNCAPFEKCNLEINDEHVDTGENLDKVMSMYNLIEYSDNYQVHQRLFININEMNHQMILNIIWDKIIQHLLTIKPN